MKSRDFVFWLQGYFELSRSVNGLDAGQANMIQQHLRMVFAHDPDISATPRQTLPPAAYGSLGPPNNQLQPTLIC